MAVKKTGEKAAAKKASAAKTVAVKDVKKPVALARPAAAPAPAAPPKRPAGPTARACPLVLDGELDAADFSSGDCLTCSEFDCRFCEAEAGSGALRSRLFASEDGDGDGDDEGFGGDSDFEGGAEEGLDESGEEGEDQF
jgi:hypothetical protein